MDDPSGLGWTGWIVVGAIVGALIGWERATRGQLIERQTIGLNIIMAIMWGMSVAIEVATVRGFLIVFLSSVGAYKIAALLGEFAGLHLKGLFRR